MHNYRSNGVIFGLQMTDAVDNMSGSFGKLITSFLKTRKCDIMLFLHGALQL